MEPERPIEKLLRAFAKKRREQAGDPLELRPSARQQLQNEITRRSATKSGGGFFAKLFFGSRPRLAFALSFIVILAIGGWLLVPLLSERKPAMLGMENRQDRKMASAKQAENSPSSPPAVAPAAPAGGPPPAPVTVAPTFAMNEDKGALGNNRRAVSGTITALKSEPSSETSVSKTPAPISKTETAQFDSPLSATVQSTNFAADALQPGSMPVATDEFGGAASAIAASEKDARQKVAPAKQSPPMTTASASFYKFAKSDAAAAAPVAPQFFNHVEIPTTRARTAGAKTIHTPVLASFRVEQNGNQMRVVDGDGSVYVGALLDASDGLSVATPPPATLQNKPVAAPSTKLRPQTLNAGNYSFRVSGTNRYLNQNVIFSGNFIPLTNALNPWTNANAINGAGNAQNSNFGLPAVELLSNSRITGKASIGNQKEIEVNATPTP